MRAGTIRSHAVAVAPFGACARFGALVCVLVAIGKWAQTARRTFDYGLQAKSGEGEENKGPAENLKVVSHTAAELRGSLTGAAKDAAVSGFEEGEVSKYKAGCARPHVQKRPSRFPAVIKKNSRFRLGGPP